MAEVLAPGQVPPGYGGSVPPTLLRQGEAPPGYEQFATSLRPEPLDLEGTVRGHLEGALNTATFGIYPFLQALVDDAMSDMTYREALQRQYEVMDQARQQSPVTFGAAEGVGAAVPAFFSAGASLPASTAQIAGRPVAQMAARQLAPQLSVVDRLLASGPARGATLGASGAGLFGFNEALGRTGGDIAEASDAAWTSGLTGGALGGALPLAFGGVSALGRGAKGLLPQSQVAGRQRTTAPIFSEENLSQAARDFRRQTNEMYETLGTAGAVRPDDLIDGLLTLQTTLDDSLLRNTSARTLIDDLISRMSGRNEGVPVGTLDLWRRESNDIIDDLWRQGQGTEARQVELLRSFIDDQILGVIDYGPARDTYLATIQLDTLSRLATRAMDQSSLSRGGVTYEQAFQRQLSRMKNTREWERFTKDQRDLITTAIRDQGPLASVDNWMTRILGGGLRRAMTNIAGGGAAVATGNVALAVPMLADAAAQATRGATTGRNLSAIVESVTGTPQSFPPVIPPNIGAQLAIPAIGARYITGGGF